MNIVAFGAGNGLLTLLNHRLINANDIQAIVDNNELKQGTMFEYDTVKIPIISLVDIVKYKYELLIVTVRTAVHRRKIVRQVLQSGVPADKVRVIKNELLVGLPIILESIETKMSSGKLYMDTTTITGIDRKTGIQRVQNNIFDIIDDIVTPIQWHGDFITSLEYKCRRNKTKFNNIEYRIHFSDKDRVLFVDSLWDEGADAIKALASIPCRKYIVVYDLIPLRETGTHPPEVVDNYKQWIDGVLKYADDVMCISRTVADDFWDYCKQVSPIRKKPLSIYWFHLGFDIPLINGTIRDAIQNFVRQKPTFLTVGTIDPRKNQSFAIQALKQAHKKAMDLDMQLLIIGKYGWMYQEFLDVYDTADAFIKEHILWIKDANDAELAWSYQNCCALLYPTKAEGFGLPLIEAAYYGLPALVSDLPVFREIAGENVDYFKKNDIAAMSEAIIRWSRTSVHPDSRQIKLYDWKECVKEVLDIAQGKSTPYKVYADENDGGKFKCHETK